ncbi:hypothetical protein G7K_1351-t1 [Saitoella complicata NRRL Y-17804]|uniref:Secreted protein n=1 Tax=Saitoella complicata (strain BCRC 22490 / CBS 7301 / JCM 7358 / NBRC 10748 / NRRL Y-17804) TaxID=698492 RepID=A0A0E9NCJ8_SAICN|nr:hypothetical protein G7K_1351-t1 [Saitoella complicata NRRL Y-17804]
MIIHAFNSIASVLSLSFSLVKASLHDAASVASAGRQLQPHIRTGNSSTRTPSKFNNPPSNPARLNDVFIEDFDTALHTRLTFPSSREGQRNSNCSSRLRRNSHCVCGSPAQRKIVALFVCDTLIGAYKRAALITPVARVCERQTD